MIAKAITTAVKHYPAVLSHLTGRARFIAFAFKGGEGSGNFGHAGRPGEVGGSAPSGGGGTNENIGKVTGDKGSEANVYKVTDASNLANIDGAIAVSIRGKNKGTILASDERFAGHSRMVFLYDPEDSIDNYVRLISEGDGTLYITTDYAGVVQDTTVAIDNIYNAAGRLVARGLPPNTNLEIDVIGGEYIITTAKSVYIKSVEQFDARLSYLVTALYDATIPMPEFVDALAALIGRQITLAYREAWTDEGEGDFPAYLTESSEAFILNQYDFVDGFARDIVDARIDGADISPLLARVPLWANRYNEAYNTAVALIVKENGGNLEWVYGDTDHCETCLNLNGIVMSAKDWETLGVYPQSAPNSKLECEGWRCQCQLVPTDKRRSPGAYGRVEEIIL